MLLLAIVGALIYYVIHFDLFIFVMSFVITILVITFILLHYKRLMLFVALTLIFSLKKEINWKIFKKNNQEN